MSLSLAITSALCYFIGTSRIGSGTYNTLGSGVWIGFICGLVYGDVAKGLLIGASIQLVYLGVVAPGGTIPTDEILAGSVAIPLALQGGLTAEMAVSLAVPFGLMGVFLDQIRKTSNIYFIHRADAYAVEGNEKGIYRCGIWYPLAVCFLIRFIPVFILQYFGSSYIYTVLNVLPKWLISGLNIAGGILPAIGFAIIIKAIGNKKLFPYYFIGYFLVKYLGINNMAAAIFGTCISVIVFFSSNEKKEVKLNG